MANFFTKLFTSRKGELVGEDQFGNKYYTERGGESRWVIYANEDEASNVPADWHLWLHKTRDEIPADMKLESKSWEKAHEPNHSGTNQAYYPPGHVAAGGQRDKATGDYEAWQP